MAESKKRMWKHCLILGLIFCPMAVLAKTTAGKTSSSTRTGDLTDRVSGIPTSGTDVLAHHFLKLSESDIRLQSLLSAPTRADFIFFRQALLSLYSQDPVGCIQSLQKIQPDFVLAPFVRYFIARAWLDQNNPDTAVKILTVQGAQMLSLENDWQWLRLEALARDKRIQELVRETALLKKKWQDEPWNLAHVHELLAWGYLEAGDKINAVLHLQEVLVDGAGSPADSRVISLLARYSLRLESVLPPPLLLQRAARLIDVGSPDMALQIYENIFAKSSGEPKKLLGEKIAYTAFKKRDYQRAAILYAALLKSGQYTSSKTEILEKLAQASARHDDFSAAMATNKSIIAQFPGTAAAGIADFKLGFLLYDAGRFRESIRHFEKYIDQGTNKQKKQARWYRLWSHYWLKNYAQTKAELQSLLASSADKSDKRMIHYWLGRVELKLGHAAAAHAQWQKLVGNDYYGLLAKQRLRTGHLDTQMMVQPALLNSPDGAGRPAFILPATGIPITLQGAFLLSLAGLDDQAYRESARFGSFATPAGLQALQISGNSVAGYVTTQAGRSTVAGADTLESLRLGYPLAYATYLSAYAKWYQVPRSLPFAIMRQESVFKPDARSPAFAVGLMQIIPPTAMQIAHELGFSNFDIGMLSEPRVNTLFGTYYLSTLLRQFSGKLVYAIAAYNAGPDAVMRWSHKSDAWEVDEFIESIPYQETREYVKRVLMNYWIYEKIY